MVMETAIPRLENVSASLSGKVQTALNFFVQGMTMGKNAPEIRTVHAIESLVIALVTKGGKVLHVV